MKKHPINCKDCGHAWEIIKRPILESKAYRCPSCGSMNNKRWKRTK